MHKYGQRVLSKRTVTYYTLRAYSSLAHVVPGGISVFPLPIYIKVGARVVHGVVYRK